VRWLSLPPARTRFALAAASVATTGAAVVTGETRFGRLPVSDLAATPDAVDRGRGWLLLTSGLLADHPILPSLLGFWIVAVAVLLVCSLRLTVIVALSGHVVSTALVYGALRAVRVFDPAAFTSVWTLQDYGLSAIIAAWLGVLARLVWDARPTRSARLGVAAGALGCAGIGIACRPDLTALDSEHVVAFAIGVVLADPRLRTLLSVQSRRLVAAATTSLTPPA